MAVCARDNKLIIGINKRIAVYSMEDKRKEAIIIKEMEIPDRPGLMLCNDKVKLNELLERIDFIAIFFIKYINPCCRSGVSSIIYSICDIYAHIIKVS